MGVKTKLVSEYGPAVGCCERDNEPSGPIKFGEFLDNLN
jgi:hypothetical protein